VQGTIVLEGWLSKKGGGGADGSMRNWAKGGRRNWKRRWVVLTDKQFVSWYDKHDRATRELKGSLGLPGAQVIAGKGAGRFWVLTNTRSLELQAEDAAGAAEWIRVLQQTANQALLPSDQLNEEAEEEANAQSSEDEELSAPAEGVPPSPRSNMVRVIFTYEAREPDELTIREGELVEVLSFEDEWWLGRIHDRIGTFPSNYVEPAAEPTLKPQRYSSNI